MKTLFRKIGLAALLGLTVVLLSGCGTDRQYAAYLNIGTTSKVVSLDTARADDCTSGSVIRGCIEGLMRESGTGTPEPGMAESYECSDDGLVYTFHLREAYWSNGTPVTAHDFVYAWRRMVTSNAPYTSMFTNIARVKNAKEISMGDAEGKRLPAEALDVRATDDRTLRVGLEAPVPYFIDLMCCWPFAPLNEAFYQSLDDGMYGTSGETFLSNGPFLLEEYIPGTYTVTLVRNPDYWDADTVTLPGIRIQTMNSPDIELEAYRKGLVDIIGLPGSQANQAKNDERLSAEIHQFYPGAMTYIVCQVEDGQLCNVQLRKAISYALNRESIVNTALFGNGEPAYNAASKHYAFHRVTGVDFAEPESDYRTFCADDPERARACLEQAKKELGKDTFEIELMYGNQAGTKGLANVALVVKEQVEKTLPGVTIKLLPVSRAEVKVQLSRHNFQLALNARNPDYADPVTMLSFWKTGAGFNFGKWSNAAYDGILDECAGGALATDYEKRWQKLKEAEMIVLDQAAMIPVNRQVETMLISRRVTGYQCYMGKPNYMFVHKEAE